MAKRVRKPLTDRQRQLKRERDRRYRERQKARLAIVETTPYQVRKARAERKLGPVRRETAATLSRSETAPRVAEVRRLNTQWVREQTAIHERLKDYSSSQFNVHDTGASSRQGLAVFVNQYHEDVAARDEGYVFAFYRAIVDPQSNYYSDHVSDAEHERYEPARMVGNKVFGNKYFREYMVNFSRVVANVDPDLMDKWFDDRYSMALAGNI